jgi:hypothetical protein
VDGVRAAAGVSVAVLVASSYATAADTAVPPDGVSVNVVGLRLAALIERLKVALTVVLGTIPVVPCAGVTLVVTAAAGVPSSITTAST